MMTSLNGNIFRVTGPLWGKSTGHQWIPLTKASDTELWCFLWSAPERTVEQTIETLVIWDAIVLIMTSLASSFVVVRCRSILPYPSCSLIWHCSILCKTIWKHRDRDKMADIFQTTFQMHFLEWKCLNFEYNLTEIYSTVTSLSCPNFNYSTMSCTTIELNCRWG